MCGIAAIGMSYIHMLCVIRPKMKNQEKIIELGVEGGSVTIFKFYDEKGKPHLEKKEEREKKERERTQSPLMEDQPGVNLS